MNTPLVALLAAFAVASCASATAESPARSELPASTVATPAQAPDATVDVRFLSPMHAEWSSATLGPLKRELGILVTNHAGARLDVSELGVHLDASRERASFHCADEVGPAPHAHEPSSLAPGESFLFERVLDCDLPLVGSYLIDVSVSFGHDAWAKRRSIRSFTISVFATPDIEPRKIEIVPGLWGALGAQRYLREDPRGGPARIVVALVNGGTVPLELPHFRLTMRVYRGASDIACEDAPIDLDTPPILAAGASFHQPVVLSCLGLGEPGSYEIVARLEVGEGSDAWRLEIGRLRIHVSTEPPPPLVPRFVPPFRP